MRFSIVFVTPRCAIVNDIMSVIQIIAAIVDKFMFDILFFLCIFAT